MEKLVKFLITSIVDVPEVKVSVQEEGELQEFTVSVPKEHMGLVIGKEGKTIKAIRNIVRILAIVEKKRFELNLVEA